MSAADGLSEPNAGQRNPPGLGAHCHGFLRRCLTIGVDQQHGPPGTLTLKRDLDRERGLADAAFRISANDNHSTYDRITINDMQSHMCN